MQVTPNQNTNKVNNTRPNNAPVQGAVQNTAAKPVQQQCSQYCGCPQYCPPQGAYYPQQVNYQTQSQQPQNVQVPATAAGVNIQIFNPSAGLPGAAAPTYNVNAPCYPSEYYTGTLGSDGKLHPNGGNGGNGGAGGVGGNGETGGGVTQSGGTQNGGNGGSSGVTQGGGIQSGGDGGSSTERETVTKETTSTNGNKKTEKRKIVQLTDDYIKALESSLNSQDENVRRNAAQEVYNRLEEDDSRCDDRALTALINKMLQDPEDTVRLLALSALEQRIVLGDDYTVNVLKNMQQTNSGYGQDAIDANKILLKMAGKQVEKEFEVKDKPSTETETTTTTETSKKE